MTKRELEKELHEQRERAEKWRQYGLDAKKERDAAVAAKGVAAANALHWQGQLGEVKYLQRKVNALQTAIDDSATLLLRKASREMLDKESLLRCGRHHCDRYCRDEEDDY